MNAERPFFISENCTNQGGTGIYPAITHQPLYITLIRNSGLGLGYPRPLFLIIFILYYILGVGVVVGCVGSSVVCECGLGGLVVVGRSPLARYGGSIFLYFFCVEGFLFFYFLYLYRARDFWSLFVSFRRLYCLQFSQIFLSTARGKFAKALILRFCWGAL